MNLRYIALFIMLLLIPSRASTLRGQSIQEEESKVHESLRQLDTSLRGQRERQVEGSKAALGPDGKRNALFWQEHDRLSPLTIYGKPVLEHAIAHPRSRQALACLSYILEYGEGDPVELYRSACKELIEHHREKGNIGFPTDIEDRKHFISMLEKSAIRSKKSDIEKLASELDDFAESMRAR